MSKVAETILFIAICLSLTLFTAACDSHDDENQTPSEVSADHSSSLDDTDSEPQVSGSVSPEVEEVYAPYPVEADISAEELHGLYIAESAPVVIDLRRYSAYDVSRIPGAISVPVAQIDSRMYQIPREVPLVLVCKTPEDGAKAWTKLLEQGYDPALIRMMSDNMEGWVAMGYEVDTTIHTSCG